MGVLANQWAVAFTVTVAFALMCLSVVVVTGYAGQLSLAQFLIGTSGAFVGARLMAVHGVAFGAGVRRFGAAATLLGLGSVPRPWDAGHDLAIADAGTGGRRCPRWC